MNTPRLGAAWMRLSLLVADVDRLVVDVDDGHAVQSLGDRTTAFCVSSVTEIAFCPSSPGFIQLRRSGTVVGTAIPQATTCVPLEVRLRLVGNDRVRPERVVFHRIAVSCDPLPRAMLALA